MADLFQWFLRVGIECHMPLVLDDNYNDDGGDDGDNTREDEDDVDLDWRLIESLGRLQLS